MNKIFIGSVTAILVLGGLVWMARPDDRNDRFVPASAGGPLVVEGNNDYDFGTISMAAGEVKHQFEIKNTGSERVTINKMYTSCMCTTAELLTGGKRWGPFGMPGHSAVPKIEGAIGPDEGATVEVVFDPAAHGPAGVGRIQRTVTLENSAGQPVELQFMATVTP